MAFLSISGTSPIRSSIVILRSQEPESVSMWFSETFPTYWHWSE